MSLDFQQHRLARIEGHRITLAQLESRFRNGIDSFGKFEEAIAALLDSGSAGIATWRRSETEQYGYREGMRLAALEFYWQHRNQVRITIEREIRARESAIETELSSRGGSSSRCLRHRGCK